MNYNIIQDGTMLGMAFDQLNNIVYNQAKVISNANRSIVNAIKTLMVINDCTEAEFEPAKLNAKDPYHPNRGILEVVKIRINKDYNWPVVTYRYTEDGKTSTDNQPLNMLDGITPYDVWDAIREQVKG